MPIYDYNCPKCDNKVEIDKSMSKVHDKEKCPSCDTLMEKEMTAPAFHLKGSGWYVNDYKNKGAKKGKKDVPPT
ncbi:MAG: hypothetical protein KAS32_27385 [Candidatus Peribacteraceae bacterium]|nr:hypothetical protein [Candidatus Peribacteraceae bacterium]